MIRLSLALFAVQAGFHGFAAALPVALARSGVPDPQIGLIVGTAAVIQLPAVFVVGAILDRVGGLRVFTFGAVAYLVACGILLIPGVEPGGPDLPFYLARLAQGIGIAFVFPSALSMVPRVVPLARRSIGFAIVGSANNLALVVLPALTLAVLSASSLHGVALVVAGFVGLSLVLMRIRPLTASPSHPGHGPAGRESVGVARRRFGFAFRRSWAGIIAIVALFVAPWGFITAYLPQRAEAAGADIGLFFVASGLGIIGSRVPAGLLTDRARTIILVGVGLVSTALAILLLVLPPVTSLLVVAGALSGIGTGLILTPLQVEISRRSGDADRGSAFALFSAAWATGLMIGSIGGAPLVGTFGFEPTILLGLFGLAAAAVIAVGDGRRSTPPGAPLPRT